jgi:hypothetical protein
MCATDEMHSLDPAKLVGVGSILVSNLRQNFVKGRRQFCSTSSHSKNIMLYPLNNANDFDTTANGSKCMGTGYTSQALIVIDERPHDITCDDGSLCDGHHNAKENGCTTPQLTIAPHLSSQF